MNHPHVHIENRRLQGVLNAMRRLGETTIPARVLLKMVKTQKTIITHLETINETNNALIKQHGETDPDTGSDHVTPEMDGWVEFQQQASILNMVEFNCGEPFVLYEREQEGETVIGWSDPVKTPLDITANLIVDAGDLLVIDLLEPEADETETAVLALVE
ncbi:MAG: hypothetical protein V3S55_10160 [Nitrospiraceae bacterium]